MRTQYKPASEESRKYLHDNMGRAICDLYLVFRYQLIVSKILREDNIKKSSTDKEGLDSVLRSLNIYSQYINIELISVLRSSFRATNLFERRYNLKYINIIILEGYKHLYGYKSNIRKSLWNKIKPFLNVNDDDEFNKDYLALSNKIEKFGEKNITNKAQRDFAIHYDYKPVSVYNMLINLSEEEEIQRVMKFWDLLEEVSSFAFKYQTSYEVDVKHELHANLEDVILEKAYDLFDDKTIDTYALLEKHIENQSDTLSRFIKLLELPIILKKQFKDVKDDSYFYIDKLVELINVSIQLLYLYIDLASATRSFISSEYIIEKQIAMKQMNIIIYEGFNKLYGVKEKKDHVFLKKYMQHIIEMIGDYDITERFTQLKQNLDSYEMVVKANRKQRQMSVHYDEGIEKVYEMMQDFNPLVEFTRALKLLNLLPRIFDLASDCVEILSAKQTVYYNKINAKTNESINQTIELLEKHSKSSENVEFIQLLKDIKSGDYFKRLDDGICDHTNTKDNCNPL